MTVEKQIARTVVGKVVSDKMDKTIVVQVERKIKHPLYGKYITRTSKMYAHDNDNIGKLGDMVEISNSRPISKTKHWMLVKVINTAENDQA